MDDLIFPLIVTSVNVFILVLNIIGAHLLKDTAKTMIDYFDKLEGRQ